MKHLLLIILLYISINCAYAQTWTPILSPPTLHTDNPLSTRVGIGLISPETMLEINSTFKDEDLLSLSYTDTGVKWNYLNLGNNYLAFNARQRSGNWEIDDGSYFANAFQIQHAWGGLDFNYYQHPTNNQGAPTPTWTGFIGNAWKTAMRIHWNGNIKIGEKTIAAGPLQGKRVTIDGELVAKGIFITSINWADYVFDENYRLASLNEVEAFINQNKHLPNIPSEKEIKENGIDLEKIAILQMEKIEELTLYIIQLNKELETVKKEIEQLKIDTNEN